MRELVYIKEYIPIAYDEHGKAISGTGKMSTAYPNIGYFHRWIIDNADEPMAVVELPDGTISVYNYDWIRFKPLPAPNTWICHKNRRNQFGDICFARGKRYIAIVGEVASDSLFFMNDLGAHHEVSGNWLKYFTQI